MPGSSLASADELLREAQYALQNVSPGSTDEHKYSARAKSYALQVVQKYPHSSEASQAREILAQLKVPIGKPASPTVTRRVLAGPSQPSAVRKPLALAIDREKINRFAARPTVDDQWRAILQRYMALPSGNKKVFFGALLLLMVLVPFSIFVIAALIVLYAFNLPALKRHLLALLARLEPKK